MWYYPIFRFSRKYNYFNICFPPLTVSVGSDTTFIYFSHHQIQMLAKRELPRILKITDQMRLHWSRWKHLLIFFSHFNKGHHLCDFLFALFTLHPFRKWSTLKEKNLLPGKPFFSHFQHIPIEKGGKNILYSCLSWKCIHSPSIQLKWHLHC